MGWYHRVARRACSTRSGPRATRRSSATRRTARCRGPRSPFYARNCSAPPVRVAAMTPRPLLRGELQEEIMAVLWRHGPGTVEAVRDALPAASRSGYRTVQTVLNRLAERGLLTREKEGHALVYRPTVSEAQYIAATVADTLEAASPQARRA